jgi:predicted PurR-regulated permease PerM
MLGIVALMAIMIVFSIALLPFVVDDVDNQNANQNNQVHTEQSVNQADRNVKVLPKKVEPIPIAKKEPVQVVIKEVAPQINNYNFESLSNVLLVVLSMIGGFFLCKYLFKFFNYLRTTHKFKKNEKKTNKLITSLNETMDNQKEFLAIADRIEHQLKINDILLRSDESKKHGLNLEVADDYLHSSYTFVNDKLIISLQ